MLSTSIWDTVIWEMATSASKLPTAQRATVATVAVAWGDAGRHAHGEEREFNRVGREQPRHLLTFEVTDYDVGAEGAAQGVSAVVVVVRHGSYGPAALTQQRDNLAANAADSPAGAGHQDEARLEPSFAALRCPGHPVVKSGTRHAVELGPWSDHGSDRRDELDGLQDVSSSSFPAPSGTVARGRTGTLASLGL